MPDNSPALVVVAAGGLGTRVHPWSQFIPKEFYPVDGRPGIVCLLGEIARLGPARVAVVYHPYYERFAAWAAQVLGRGDHARYAGSGGGPYSGWHVDLGPRARQDRASRTIALLLADPARHGTHPGESHRADIIAAHSAGTDLVLASVLLRGKGLLWTQDYLQRRARLYPAGTAEIFVALAEAEPDPDEVALARLRLPL